MALTHADRVGSALEVFTKGMWAFVRETLEHSYPSQWSEHVEQAAGDRATFSITEGPSDPQIVFSLILDRALWDGAFTRVMSAQDRSYIFEIKEYRNRWAHKESITGNDAYRAIDSMHRVLQVAGARDHAAQLDEMRDEILRVRQDDRARRERKKVQDAFPGMAADHGLPSWREIATPHHDVRSGDFQMAEFAADLSHVAAGKGTPEYLDPSEFFRRTYITDGLRELLVGAIKRLSGAGGAPIVKARTNFGGGKTHSMLALYHLFGGKAAASDLEGIPELLREARVEQLPTAARAVFVGTDIGGGQADVKADGTRVNTMWGEIAWQLGGAEAFAMIAESDANSTPPGSAVLAEMFDRFGPCLVLIDEWIRYISKTYRNDNLPAGTYDNNFGFAQELNEAARKSERCLVVASLPASQIEFGGTDGEEALKRLENVFDRQAEHWRPASEDEGFEIVRRRLFEPITSKEQQQARDRVAAAFVEWYSRAPGAFPPPVREKAYEERIRQTYPIHPELFDRLYHGWAGLERFQQTRGVLRLMATVIHALWEGQDGGALVLPSSIPIADPDVQLELTRHLDNANVWKTVVSTDVDGESSLPIRLEREHREFGKHAAARRVARSIYVASAPLKERAPATPAAIRLACSQPGDKPAVYTDALRYLSEQATYLYDQNDAYWFDTQPGLNRMATDRAETLPLEQVEDEISRRLRTFFADTGAFASVVVAPATSSDIADDPVTRLVALGPQHPHGKGDDASAASEAAREMLELRGEAKRTYRNTLVFLASERERQRDLDAAARQFLAWTSIAGDAETLDLPPHQKRQAELQRDRASDTLTERMREAWQRILVPTQKDGTAPVEWRELRLTGGSDPLAQQVTKKLVRDGLLLTEFSSVYLKRDLDAYLWTESDHVGVRDLVEYYARYLYLHRLANRGLIEQAIIGGVAQLSWSDYFAYAHSFDPDADPVRPYHGLTARELGAVEFDGESLLVKPEIASLYPPLNGDDIIIIAGDAEIVGEDGKTLVGGTPGGPTGDGGVAVARKTRFYGSVAVDPVRLGAVAAQINDEVVRHLTALPTASVSVTIEISADAMSGVPDDIVMRVAENCSTLKFDATRTGWE